MEFQKLRKRLKVLRKRIADLDDKYRRDIREFEQAEQALIEKRERLIDRMNESPTTSRWHVVRIRNLSSEIFRMQFNPALLNLTGRYELRRARLLGELAEVKRAHDAIAHAEFQRIAECEDGPIQAAASTLLPLYQGSIEPEPKRHFGKFELEVLDSL